MPVVDLRLQGDGAFPELEGMVGTSFLWHDPHAPLTIAYLDGGMVSGKPSLVLRVDYPGGRVALAETSVDAFLAAARAISARAGM